MAKKLDLTIRISESKEVQKSLKLEFNPVDNQPGIYQPILHVSDQNGFSIKLNLPPKSWGGLIERLENYLKTEEGVEKLAKKLETYLGFLA